MKILIVDDEHQKIRSAATLLTESCGIPSASIKTARTADEAKALMEETAFDILLLDIVLPANNHSDPAPETSVSLVLEIESRPHYQKPSRIIGFTAFEGLSSNTLNEFSKRAWTIIQYSNQSNDWQQSLKNAVDYSKLASERQPILKYITDLCVITALRSPELDAVRRLPWNWQSEEPLDDITWISRGHFFIGNRKVTVSSFCAPRMGLVASALCAAKAINLLRPKFLCMTGICAGIAGKADIGDVLVANPSWNWQSGKHKFDELGPHFNASPHDLPLPEYLRSRVEQLNANKPLLASIKSDFTAPPVPTELSVRCGPVASGSAVVADEEVLLKLLEVDRGMMGLEMEVYGLYAAAYLASHPRPSPIALKSVCDFGTKDKNDNYQVYAAYTSAQVMRHFFESNFIEIEAHAGMI